MTNAPFKPLTNTAMKKQINYALRMADYGAQMAEGQADLIQTLREESFGMVRDSMEKGVLEIPKAAAKSFEEAQLVEETCTMIAETEKQIRKMLTAMSKRFPEFGPEPKAKASKDANEAAKAATEAEPVTTEAEAVGPAVTDVQEPQVETVPSNADVTETSVPVTATDTDKVAADPIDEPAAVTASDDAEPKADTDTQDAAVDEDQVGGADVNLEELTASDEASTGSTGENDESSIDDILGQVAEKSGSLNDDDIDAFGDRMMSMEDLDKTA